MTVEDMHVAELAAGTEKPSARSARGSPAEELWTAVDRLIDRGPRLSDLVFHRLEYLAARRWRAQGRGVPRELLEAETYAAVVTMMTPVLLERVRAACDGPLILMKGYEVAARYPDAMLRPYKDIDLLVPDSERTHNALLAAGFVATGMPELYVDIHHLRPLYAPGGPLVVEIHSSPKWPQGIAVPTVEELLGDRVPAAVGVDGISALPPAQHAVVLAAHAWAHAPLGQLGRLVDIAAVSHGVDRVDLERVAERWGLSRVWRTTAAATDDLLFGGRRTLAERTWARNLVAVRERSVVEKHLEYAFAPLWSLPFPEALKMVAAAIGRLLRPKPGEGWRVKLSRTARALRTPFARLSEHHQALDAKDRDRRE